jgi:hypothetical protein
MKRRLSYLLGFLVVLLLGASIFAPAPGSQIVLPEKQNDCKVLQEHYQACISTHPDVTDCEEITTLWIKCMKNQRSAVRAK